LDLPRLPFAAAEARTAAGYGRGSVLRLRAEASESFVKHAALDRFAVLHFAAHAVADPGSVSRTALALAPGDGEDGLLHPGEITRLRLGARVVILSACRTAAGASVAGEGLQGLTSALLEAGARAVVASRWKVEDRATAALMADLYEGLADGMALDASLQRAQRMARDRGTPAADWAAFVVTGDGGGGVALARPWPVSRLWLLGAVALAGLVVWWASRRGAPLPPADSGAP
jgi:CHAT domain-containing protein